MACCYRCYRCFCCCCGRIFAGAGTDVGESESVEACWVGVDFWVHGNGLRGDADSGSGGDEEAVC